jgi:hypothetical protein
MNLLVWAWRTDVWFVSRGLGSRADPVVGHHAPRDVPTRHVKLTQPLAGETLQAVCAGPLYLEAQCANGAHRKTRLVPG